MITLKTLEQASRQEVFDQVATHFLRQNLKAVTIGRNCQYRVECPSGSCLKCAAGCLIGDEDDFDHEVYGNLEWPLLVNDGVVPDSHVDIILRLQRIHDKVSPEYWEGALRGLAATEQIFWQIKK